MFQVIIPRLKEGINIFKEKNKNPKYAGREIFLLTIFLIIIFSTFKGSLFFIKLFPAPLYPLNLIFKMLFALILFSGAIISINEFFISKDLNVFLASPLSSLNFYIGKIFLTLFSATWMPLCLLIPCLIAFGVFYNQNIFYYILIPAVVIPFLSIPILVGNIFVFLFSKIIPIKIFKEILFFFYLGVFLSFGILIKKVFIITFDKNFQIPENKLNILPFDQASNILSEVLLNNNLSIMNLIYLYGGFILLFFISFYFFKRNYFKVFNAISSFSSSDTIFIKNLESIFLKLTKFLTISKRGQFLKEYKTFIRNLGQSSQMFLLLGITFLYFSNLEVLNYKSSLETYNLGLLIIMNLAISTFILIAFCSRFVFPSLSLEAKAYDIYLKSPISLKSFFNTKKLFWFCFLSLIASTIFVSGTLALNLNYNFIVLSFFLSIFLSYGLINIAMLIGTYFLNLNWKNPYQLCASVGSLCFMLAGVAYLFLSFFIYRFSCFLFNFKNKTLESICFLILLFIFNLTLSLIITKLSIKKLSYSLNK